MKHGRYISWDNGTHGYDVSGYDGNPEDLLKEMIEHLIKWDSNTFKPRIKWWQFWREKFNADITAEYIRQLT